jgi:type I restriction enzyme S subunit
MKAIYGTLLPDGWCEEPLAKLVATRRGYTWEKSDEVDRAEADTMPVIRIPNVQETLDLSDLVHLRNVSPEAIEKAAVTKDWLLFVGSNGTQNRIGDSVLIEEDRPMVFASFLMGIQPKDQNTMRSDFFAHWMRLHLVHEIFSKTSQQTTGLANFSWGAVKRLPVRFPVSTEEQRRIAAALKLADDAIQKARAELDATQELKRSLMKLAFSEGLERYRTGWQETKLGRIPASWKIKRVKDVLVSKPSNGYSPQSNSEPPGTKTLNVACIRNGECDISKATYVDIEDTVVESLQVRDGDFFVLRGNGNRDFIGIGGVVRHNVTEPMIYSDLLFRLRFNESESVPLFIPYLWQSQAFLHRLQSKAKSGSGLWKIGKRDIENETLALPGKEEQRDIVSLIESATSACNAAAQKVTALQSLKRALLQNLLTGKIRIPEGAIHA